MLVVKQLFQPKYFTPLYIYMSALFLEQEDDARVKRAFQTLLTYVGNVARNPAEEKFRKIRLSNAAFQVRKSVKMVRFVLWHFQVVQCSY